MKSPQAQVASLIRKELKAHGIAGRVRSDSGSMTTSVTVTLFDPAPGVEDAVKRATAQYQYGHFDGMTDCYEHSNSRRDIPQVKFLFVETQWSDAASADAWAYTRATFADASDTDEPATMDDHDLLYRVMRGTWGRWDEQRKPRVRAA